MRRRESVYEFSERYEDLNRVFKEVLYSGHYETQYDAMSVAVRKPARRFYVSERRLAEVVNMMENGVPVNVSRRSPRYRMFMELYQRYTEAMEAEPGLTKMEACCKVIYQQAPEFYIKPSWGLKILYKGRQKRRRVSAHRRKEAQ